jgi:hypothetical protein
VWTRELVIRRQVALAEESLILIDGERSKLKRNHSELEGSDS